MINPKETDRRTKEGGQKYNNGFSWNWMFTFVYLCITHIPMERNEMLTILFISLGLVHLVSMNVKYSKGLIEILEYTDGFSFILQSNE